MPTIKRQIEERAHDLDHLAGELDPLVNRVEVRALHETALYLRHLAADVAALEAHVSAPVTVTHAMFRPLPGNVVPLRKLQEV